MPGRARVEATGERKKARSICVGMETKGISVYTDLYVTEKEILPLSVFITTFFPLPPSLGQSIDHTVGQKCDSQC